MAVTGTPARSGRPPRPGTSGTRGRGGDPPSLRDVRTRPTCPSSTRPAGSAARSRSGRRPTGWSRRSGRSSPSPPRRPRQPARSRRPRLRTGPAASPTPSPPPTTVAGALHPTVVSSAIWAGGRSPVILTLDGPSGRLADPALLVTAQCPRIDDPSGPGRRGARATAARGSGPLCRDGRPPDPGLVVADRRRDPGRDAAVGSVALTALDPGASAAGGRGAVRPDADPGRRRRGPLGRLDRPGPRPPSVCAPRRPTRSPPARPSCSSSTRSRFRVSPACGRGRAGALPLDRWPSRSSISSRTATRWCRTPRPGRLLLDPTLTDLGRGVGDGRGPVGLALDALGLRRRRPGMVRAEYQGVIGSDDVDVILSLIAPGG